MYFVVSRIKSNLLVLAFSIALLSIVSISTQNIAAAGKIAFTSNRNGEYEIYVMNSDGTNQKRLTNNTITDFEPAFSPDGSQIAFSSQNEIYVINSDGTNRTRLIYNSMMGYLQPSFSPDGSQIAVLSIDAEIYVANSDGTNLINLTNSLETIDVEPSWGLGSVECQFSLSTTSVNFTVSGGNGSVNVTAGNGCAWTAQSNVNWITVTNVSSNNGNGTVNFSVFANTGVARSGTITIGGQTFTITQAGGCSYSLSPSSANIPAIGGSGSFNVNAGAGCSWVSSSNDSWITVTGIHIGTGNGWITYNFQPNTGMARTGTISVNGQTFTVNQASGCSYSLSSTGANISAGGGTLNFNVNTGTDCQWTVVNFSTWLTITSANSGSGNGTVSLSVQANNLTIARSATLTVGDLVFTVNQSARTSVFSDFDGDGKADISVFRPENGAWYLLNSTSGFRAVGFGLGTDKLAPADYDGDLKTDIAVWRENPDDPGKANFYILRSSDNLFQEIQFGSTGDIPVSGDFNGDGRADLAVYRKGANNTQSYFYYRPSAQPGVNLVSIQWGSGDDKPVVADYDGDGKADVAVYRPSNGAWYIRRSRDGFLAIQFGVAEDKPVVGDYDGDGKADIAVYRPSNGAWYLLQSRDGFGAAQFGITTDKPVPADYDGDGKTDLGVYRPENGAWYLLQSRSGFGAVGFGIATDKPIPNAFVP